MPKIAQQRVPVRLLSVLKDGKAHALGELTILSPTGSAESIQQFVSRLRKKGYKIRKEPCYTLEGCGP